jgi:hypothetical protein
MIQKSDNNKVPFINDWLMILLACLTLGLAPFYPEPHIWGKLRWIWGGGNGMQAIDYFDFIWHLWPWLLLIRLIGIHYYKQFSISKSLEDKS